MTLTEVLKVFDETIEGAGYTRYALCCGRVTAVGSRDGVSSIIYCPTCGREARELGRQWVIWEWGSKGIKLPTPQESGESGESGGDSGRRKPRFVLQDWVGFLPLRFQGTLLAAVRGCDVEPKTWTATGVSFSPGRRLTAYIRWCFMNPADPREVDREEGAFLMSNPPDPFRPSEFGHLPQHWYAHAMHALEVIGRHHPTDETSGRAMGLYHAMVHNLHLNPETEHQHMERLTEDRIAKGTVVS